MTQLKKEVLLIRHGESFTNGTTIYQAGDQFAGDPLSQHGLTQSDLLADEFVSQKYTPNIIIASYYQRARQTAQPTSLTRNTPIIVPVYQQLARITDLPLNEASPHSGRSLFRELDLPLELEGRHYDDVEAIAIKDAIRAHRYDEDWHYSNEESLFDIWQRAATAVAYIAARPESKIAIFSHGGFIKACLAWILFDHQENWPLRQKLEAYQAFTSQTWVDNAGIISLFQDAAHNKWQWLVSYNRHLSSSFGFLNNEPIGSSDTSADELHNDTTE